MKYILSIGINDYRNCPGGTNKVILSHQKIFEQKGYGYFYLCVAGKNDKLWEIIINNQYGGIKSTEHIRDTLAKIQIEGNSILEIHIHHLVRVSLEELDKLLSYIKVNIKFFIHDFFTICPSIKLLKGDGTYCGCEPMSKEKCFGCEYYKKKQQNIQLRELIEKYRDQILFIAPSEFTKESWIKAYPQYEEKVLVINHQQLEGRYQGNRTLTKNDAIKVAYLGEKSYAKGWNTWCRLIKAVDDKKYSYYYFGKEKTACKDTINISVDFKKDLNAMMLALRKENIDCVVLWSICEETYSYTYYESLASDVFVITNKQSGNIAKQVKERNNGIVLSDEQELVELFKNTGLLFEYLKEYKSGDVICPERLLDNSEIISCIKYDNSSAIVGNIKYKLTVQEIVYSLFYLILQVVYFLRGRIG